MALGLKDYGAWVLNPYCFCEQRRWLTINDLGYIDLEGNKTDGGIKDGGVLTSSGLSDEDTALLAALLTALAVFLFLLFLLLCLLCPLGVCCGKKGICCGGASKNGHSGKSRSGGKNGSENGSVTLTAVDLKIPRPWAETGFSDSELDKRTSKDKWGSAWQDGGMDSAYWWGGQGKNGMVNSAYHGDEFQDGRWFSTSDLDSIYGGKGQGYKGWQNGGELVAMDEFYRGSIKKSGSDVTRIRHNSYSEVENLMTSPHRDVSVHSNMDVYSSHAGSGHHGDQGRVMEATTVTKQEMTKSMAVPVQRAAISGSNGMNSVAEISMHDVSSRDLVPSQAPPPYNNHVTETVMSSNLGNGEFRSSSLPVGEIISTTYSRAYREVVEETTTE